MPDTATSMPRTGRAMILRFQPLIDWWVIIGSLFLVTALSAGIPVVIAATSNPWITVAALLILVFTILYIVDGTFFTYYELTPQGLVVGGQMRRILFPYRNIVEIKRGGLTGLVSFRGKKRYALSSSCFVIKLVHEHWRAITVSPAFRDKFLNLLLEAIDQERSSRATVVRSNRKRKERS